MSFRAFSLNYKYLESVRTWEHLQKKTKKHQKPRGLIVICLPAGLCYNLYLCTESGLKPNLLPLHLNLQLLLGAIPSTDSNLFIIKLHCCARGHPTVMWPEGASSWTCEGRQAGRQTHERNCCRCTFHRPGLSAFLPVLAICFFLSLFFAPVMEVLVQFKVKA